MTTLNRPRNEFLKRLSMYLVGNGIGFMLVSIFHRMRQVSAPQSAPQAEASQDPATVAPEPAPAAP